MNPKQEGIFNYLFSIIDHSGNGAIEEADLLALFGGFKRDVEPARADFVDRVARRWYLSLKAFADTDRDRVVTQSEWQTWLNGFVVDLAETDTLKREHQHFVDAIFASIALGEAVVTKDDYLNWFNVLGLKGDADAIFAAMDTNDENKGVITKEEYDQHFIKFLKGEEGAVSILGDF